MPLDGNAYLKAQGWEGQGSGLRHGAISRPVIVAQKKTLSGIGKDRDEAFPFWDHVFNAAATAIKVKVYDSDSEDTESSSTPAVTLERTRTGIISNRRPTTGTPVLSGTATPDSELSSSSASGSSTPKLNILSAAKQAAARRSLYAMFFRGPVLSSDFEDKECSVKSSSKDEEAVVEVTEVLEDVELGTKEGKKRKRESLEDDERKRRKRERKEKKRSKESNGDDNEEAKTAASQDKETSKRQERDGVQQAREAEKLAKAERKRLRAEKRAKKEERRRRKAQKASDNIETSQEDDAKVPVDADNVVVPSTEKATKARRKEKNRDGTEKKSQKQQQIP